MHKKISQERKLIPKIKHKIELAVIRGNHELKRGIKRNLVKSFKNCVFRLMIIQKILSVTIDMLKRSSLKLKLKLSVILQYMPQLKTKMITILTCALQFINVQATKKENKR